MEIHWYQLLFQIINFGILIFVLNKFLYKPIITIISQRNKKIQDSIKVAERNLKEKAQLDEFKKKIRFKAEKEATEVLNQAKKQADQRSKIIIQDAKKEAQVLVDKEFDNLKEKLKDEEIKMKNRIGSLVIDTTSKVLSKALSAKDQKRIIDQELKMLKKVKTSR
ncbi:MAG: F0F1 ATP synthase subunit B [Patescibacteria group bacterium]|nr:F0F1 ATP synthase subunit B [Patescibacteria group bacterium]